MKTSQDATVQEAKNSSVPISLVDHYSYGADLFISGNERKWSEKLELILPNR